MASVHYALGVVSAVSKGGGFSVPVIDAVPSATGILTSGGSPVQSPTLSPSGSRGNILSVTAIGGDVWVQIGDNPQAEEGSDWPLFDGQTREFAITGSQKLSVIDQ